METVAMPRLVLIATLAFAAAGAALAQTPAPRRNPPAPPPPVQVTGAVTSSDLTSMMITTADGKTVMAMFGAGAAITQASGAPIPPEDIKIGTTVTVTGTPPGADGMMDATKAVLAPPK